MGASYAVVWREPEGTIYSGSLDLSPDGLRFQGAVAGRPVERLVRYADLDGLQTLRRGSALLDGRTTLLLELAPGESLHVAAVAGVGALAELAEIVAERLAGSA